jgi:iron(III) transport system ATP-binding protein
MSLHLRGVTKDFAGPRGAVHRAVAELTLDIEQGSFCTLLGPSGCGKTTLLRLIAGFEQPTAGEILHHGRSIAAVPPYRRGFPLVFQSYALFPHMSVFDNVAYGLRVRRIPRRESAARAARALALLGLDALGERHPAQLSGGQQQRVALARCLVLEPEIILLDEPLSNLDAGLRVSMRREIRSLQQRLGITAVYVTHDQEEALAVSDHVVVMNDGRIEQAGPPDDVYHRPATDFVARFMGCRNVFPVEPIGSDRIRLLGVEHDRPPAARGEAYAVVRSDALMVRPAGGRHRARVAESTFLGARVHYVLQLDDGTAIELDEPAQPGAAPWRVGDEVGFDIALERVHFIRAPSRGG